MNMIPPINQRRAPTSSSAESLVFSYNCRTSIEAVDIFFSLQGINIEIIYCASNDYENLQNMHKEGICQYITDY